MAALTLRELTAATAVRQLLHERARVSAGAAIRRLTPLQGQHPPAPYIALAARVEGFDRPALERALARRTVVKTTIMRLTLHLAAAADYPAYAQLTRQGRMRTWRREFAHLDEARVTAELGPWLREPRTNPEIRRFVGERYAGVAETPWAPIIFARTLLPLVQLPPAGYWDDERRPRFVLDGRPLPEPLDAAALVLRRYLAAFGPATRRDAASWAGVAQGDFAGAWERVGAISLRDEDGRELHDLPRALRFLSHWDQPLLAYADRDRIIPPEVQPLKLTLSGDPTVTVDGRVAASWALERDAGSVRLTVRPHVELSRRTRREIREEGERTARFCAPDAERCEVAVSA